MSRSKAVIIAVVVSLCVIQVAGLLAYRAYRQDGKTLTGSRMEEDELRLSGGVPVQRKRIDDFIQQVASLDEFDKLAIGLNDRIDADFDIVFHAGAQTNAPNPQMQYARVLADRRAARLYSMLAAMPPDEAAKKAAELFESKLAIHSEGLTRGIADWRDGDGVIEPVPISLNHQALSVALFMCASFCDTVTVFAKLAEWDSVIGRSVDDVVTDQKLWQLRNEVVTYGRPENLFLVNVFAYLLQRGGCFSIGVLESVANQSLPQFENMPFYAWDAHTTEFDFTHVHRGVPTDKSKELFAVPFARDWPGYMAEDETEQERVVQLVREEVAKCKSR